MLYVTGKQFTDAMNEVNEAFARLTARIEKLEKQVKEGKENASKKRPKAS